MGITREIETEVAIVGAGPAGLSAAYEIAKAGGEVAIFDENERPGGQLFKQIHKFFGSSRHGAGVRGIHIGSKLLADCEEAGVEIHLNAVVYGIFPGAELGVIIDGHSVRVKAKKVLIATGATEKALAFDGWDKPGVMGAGAAQTMCNYHRVLPGKKILMLGTGNVGLIVSYQLMQGGADIVALVEAQPQINGYGVHASKLTREGIPLYTGYTIKEAHGTDRVNEVVIAKVNPDWTFQEGTEITLEVDTVCIGTGMKPLIGLQHMAGCHIMNDRALGGWAPCHDRNMETTVPHIYVAGDSTGIEEANTAIEEGKLAGISIAESYGYISHEKAKEEKDAAWERLAGLREGASGEIRTAAKEHQIEEYNRFMGGETA